VFGIIALSHGINAHDHGVRGAATPKLSWFSLHSAGGSSGLIAGMLISVFWYSGWETSVVVNEETRRANRNPGLAGIGSLVGVLIVSIVLAMLFLTDVSPTAMNANAGWLTQTGLSLAGRPWGYVLTFGILLGYLGGIETTIITFGNVGYSMGRDNVLWRSFAKVSDRTGMPWFAILLLTIPSYIMFLIQVWASGNSLATVLGDLASSLGLMFVVYYALTGIASAWLLRTVASKRLSTLITGILLPLVGSGVLIWIGAKSWAPAARQCGSPGSSPWASRSWGSSSPATSASRRSTGVSRWPTPTPRSSPAFPTQASDALGAVAGLPAAVARWVQPSGLGTTGAGTSSSVRATTRPAAMRSVTAQIA
jgi:amino acid transporter